MSWLALLVLAAGAYGCKAVGVLAMGGREPSPRASALLALLPVPLLAALVAVQTFSSARELVLDARAAALGVAGVAVWWRAPFLVVVLVGRRHCRRAQGPGVRGRTYSGTTASG